MAKKAISRTLLGFPLGIAISYTISIIISLVLAKGSFSAVAPQLVAQTGSEMSAVLLQYLLSGLLGAVFSGSSCVWEMESWSLLKQTVVHFIILTTIMMPIAWLNHWMPRSSTGIFLYIAIFVFIYILIFISMFIYWKSKVKQINERITR